VLAQRLAHDIEPARQRGVAESSFALAWTGDRLIVVSDFSGLASWACALASAIGDPHVVLQLGHIGRSVASPTIAAASRDSCARAAIGSLMVKSSRWKMPLAKNRRQQPDVASKRKIEANRRNARKSTGPRSSAGKRRTSRNSYRHGFSTRVTSSAERTKRIERLTRKIAGNATDVVILECARDAAQAELDLAQVRRAKVALIERMLAFGEFQAPAFDSVNAAGRGRLTAGGAWRVFACSDR
jgi:hypothetical protein